ncbi:MAG: hypothetical protein P4K83_12090 [Terracidiphilus sp.]|nr:hypothetical protein [Terracidiphilus sp.]
MASPSKLPQVASTLRYTYRSWLDETSVPMKVQQELMRHASARGK